MDRRTGQTIDELVTRLQPVRPLRSPWLRATSWLLIACIALATVVFVVGVCSQALQRMSTPLFWVQVSAPTLVGIGGAYAAFMLAMPDRDWRWTFVPMPMMALWAIWAALQACREMNAPGSCWNAVWGAMRIDLIDPVGLLAMLTTSLVLGWSLLKFNRHAWLGQRRNCAVCGAAAVTSLSVAAAVFYRETMSVPSILICHVGFCVSAKAFGFAFGDRLVRLVSPRG